MTTRTALVALCLCAHAATPAEPHNAAMDRVHVCYPGEHGELTGRVLEMPIDRPTPAEIDAASRIHNRGGFAVTTLIDNGRSDNRVDIVFMGDGYTADELDLFRAQVDQQIEFLFNMEPFKTYQRHFNVHRIDVVSNESGIDHDPTYGIERDTALHTGFWCGDVQRGICGDSSIIRSISALAPGDEQVVILCNSTTYGGAASFAQYLSYVSAGNSWANWVLVHELGHSFAHLEDEYTIGGPTTYTGPEPGRENVSIYDADEQIALETKWHLWMGEAFPEFDGPIGAYEGALYSRFGIHRPSPNSLMRTLGRRFNIVAIEQLVRWTHINARILDGHTPRGDYHGHDHSFHIELIEPVGHDLTVWWQVGSQVIPGSEGRRSMSLCELQLQPGEYTLIAKVRDDTPWVRDQQVGWTTYDNVWWDIVIDTPPGDRTADGVLDLADIVDFVVDFAALDPSADLAEPQGVFDMEDVLEFVRRFQDSCGG